MLHLVEQPFALRLALLERLLERAQRVVRLLQFSRRVGNDLAVARDNGVVARGRGRELLEERAVVRLGPRRDLASGRVVEPERLVPVREVEVGRTGVVALLLEAGDGGGVRRGLLVERARVVRVQR